MHIRKFEVSVFFSFSYFQSNICLSMEDGGVDTTVKDGWQHKIGQMADFPPLLASSVFD